MLLISFILLLSIDIDTMGLPYVGESRRSTSFRLNPPVELGVLKLCHYYPQIVNKLYILIDFQCPPDLAILRLDGSSPLALTKDVENRISEFFCLGFDEAVECAEEQLYDECWAALGYNPSLHFELETAHFWYSFLFIFFAKVLPLVSLPVVDVDVSIVDKEFAVLWIALCRLIEKFVDVHIL